MHFIYCTQKSLFKYVNKWVRMTIEWDRVGSWVPRRLLGWEWLAFGMRMTCARQARVRLGQDTGWKIEEKWRDNDGGVERERKGVICIKKKLNINKICINKTHTHLGLCWTYKPPLPPHLPSSGQKTPCWVDRAGPGIFTIPTNEAHSERVKKFAYSN